jgi:hypothetical protein
MTDPINGRIKSKKDWTNNSVAASIAAIPVPGLDVVINTALLVHEVCHYMSVFEINTGRVYSLTNFDHSLLNCRSLLEPNYSVICISFHYMFVNHHCIMVYILKHAVKKSISNHCSSS